MEHCALHIVLALADEANHASQANYLPPTSNIPEATTMIEGWGLCLDHAKHVLKRNIRYPDGRLIVLLERE